MRIAVVAHSAVRLGGVETYLADVIPALAARGHDIGCWFESTRDDGEPLAGVDHTGPTWISTAVQGNALQPLSDWRPDVIYQHGLRSVDVERQLTAVAPVAFFAHSYYGACISGDRTTRFPVMHPCGRVFGPRCLAHYFPRRCGGWSPATMVDHYRIQRSKQRLLEVYDAVLVASRHMARVYEAHHVSARVVPLPLTHIAPHARRDRSEGWRLLYLGRLERSKGVRLALQSAARVADVLGVPIQLVIAGQGSLDGALRRDAATLRRRNPGLTVEFAGWIAQDRRAALFADADLLLMPSLWPEPFGLVGLEAASAGVPAVAFRVGGIAEWLIDDLTGVAVPVDRDPLRRFADAIIHLVSDRAKLALLGRNARQRARDFTMSAHLDRLEPILREVARGRHDGQP